MDDPYLTLQGEFLDEARDRLSEMEECLNDIYMGVLDPTDGLIKLKREAHTLKGMGNAFGFPLITVLTHRLEDYLSYIEASSPDCSKDIQYYIDRMWDVVRRGENPDNEESKEILRGLPIFKKPSHIDVTELETEVLLVCDSKTIGRKIGNDLSSFGFRVINASSAMDALSVAASMHPDVIITNGTMKGISGFDLIRALVAMHATREIPLAVFTSYDLEHPEVLALSSDIPVIQLGSDVSNELTLALTNLEHRFLKK